MWSVGGDKTKLPNHSGTQTVYVLRSVHMHDTLTNNVRTDAPSQPQLYGVSDISMQYMSIYLKPYMLY